MEEIEKLISDFIKNLREEDPKTFKQVMMSSGISKYPANRIVPIVNAVVLLPEKDTRPLIQQAFIGSQAHGLKFGVGAVIMNGWNKSEIINFVRETHFFEITEEEIQTIMNSPELIIKSKTDFRNIERQESYFEGIIRIYGMTNGNEEGYLINSRAYVITRIMIDNSFRETFNPISLVANDYHLFSEFYAQKLHDRTTDTQFSKYSLLTLAKGLDFSEASPARLYDTSSDVTILLCGVEDNTFQYLRKLKMDYPFELSLKPSSRYFIEGQFLMIRLLEHLEIGGYFNDVDLDGTLITKLYNDSYEALWVNIYDMSITFEEILNDFQIYDGNVVTQVIHCEYFRDGETYFVKHLDHEFIFYSGDEYLNRQDNVWQKGNARKRIKTFKIDNGRIPIRENNNVLFNLLEMKFKHKSLIKEYFEKVREAL